MQLALFDFDHTLIRTDSLLDFTRRTVGRRAWWLGLVGLLPAAGSFLLRQISRQQFKERWLAAFFKGWPASRFRQAAGAYARQRIPALLRPPAWARMRWHLAQGHRVVIVTASAADWIEAWAEAEGVALIASRLEIQEGCVTGRLQGANCRGPEKAARIRETMALEGYERIYAYGDSRGDREMLALAHEPYFRAFPRG